MINLSILTPLAPAFVGKVKSVSVPTEDGMLTILPDHAPLVAVIKSGELKVVEEGGEESVFAVFSGVLDVRPESNVAVLVDRSENVSTIDLARAEQAVERARKLLEEKSHESDVDFARFEAMLEKELNRVRVATKWKK